MSVKKTKATKYHETEQEVKFKLSQLNIRNIQDKQSIKIHGVLVGSVGDTAGQVDKKKANAGIEIISGFSSAEKAAAKTFLKAMERELAKQIPELQDEPHDESDVF